MNIECVKNGIRIPMEYRNSKENAIKFLNYIKYNNIKIENNDIYALASWVGYNIDNYNIDDKYIKINKIEYIGEEQTYDLSIDNGHSFVSNGIICHNTVNLPNNVSEDLVNQVLIKAWESKCKGVTIYRDGSRSGVLVSNNDKKEQNVNIFKENNAPRRPKRIQCDVVRFMNKGERWIGFLGLLDSRPYEIFTGLEDAINIPKYIEKGEIVKHKGVEADGHSRYDFEFIDKDGVKHEFNGLSRAFNREYWNTGKAISAVLRHGMPLANVMSFIDSLDLGDNENITSWRNGIKRILKKYIKDGTKMGGKKCPECGGEIIFKEGCESCSQCGYSKCG